MPREPIKVVADILNFELGLSSGQIMLSEENFTLPKTPGLFVALSYVSSRPIGTAVTNVPAAEGVAGMTEVQEAAMDHTIQLDVMSFNDDARLRKEEIVMAFASNSSQRFQADNGVQIARHTAPFIDASTLEETQMLKRFITTIRVKALHRKTKSTDYYDQFQNAEVHSNA